MMAKVIEGAAKKITKKPKFEEKAPIPNDPERPETLQAFAKAVGERMGTEWVEDQMFRYKQRKERAR